MRRKVQLIESAGIFTVLFADSGLTALFILNKNIVSRALCAVLILLLGAGLIWNELTKRTKLDRSIRQIYAYVSGDGEMMDDRLSYVEKLSLLSNEIPKIIEQRYMVKVIEKQTKLKTLQEQINPHFLYNTLESIRGEALMEGVERIAEMTEMLSSMFRYSISSQKDIVRLFEELENVNCYFAIQKYRFGERINLEVQCEDQNLMKCCIPKLLVQPIVENAVVHGLENTEEKGRVVITISHSTNFLLLSFADNGNGMDGEKTEEMNRIFEQDLDIAVLQGKDSIALKNVSQRIKLYYGNDYGLHVYSTLGIGTEFVMRLPKIYRYENRTGP